MTTVPERFRNVIEATDSDIAEIRQKADANHERTTDVLLSIPGHEQSLNDSISELLRVKEELRQIAMRLRAKRRSSIRRVRRSRWRLWYIQWLLRLQRARSRLGHELSWRTQWTRLLETWQWLTASWRS